MHARDRQRIYHRKMLGEKCCAVTDQLTNFVRHETDSIGRLCRLAVSEIERSSFKTFTAVEFWAGRYYSAEKRRHFKLFLQAYMCCQKTTSWAAPPPCAPNSSLDWVSA